MLYMMGGDLGNMVYDGGNFKLKVAISYNPPSGNSSLAASFWR